ncbi:MAG TPA: CmcJ/NvfI family oxidoreductase [Kofleriaceae bacterium]|nr:CmcJ/NvfI family oxidoreductase [Kofleriaceae bacterium]
MNYLIPPAEKPRSLAYEPPPGVAPTTAAYEAHTVDIHDVRPIAGELSLDREGLRLETRPTELGDFDDDDELRRVYYPETERLVAELTGAARVVIFDHTIRRRIPGVEDRTTGAPRQPVPRVHNDYTVQSGPQRVHDVLADEAESLLRRRFSIINVWRPIRAPLEDSPLALCDARTISPADLVATDLVYPDRTGEIYYVTYNPAHRWLYAPRMTRDEAFAFKVYDSALDGRARFVPHSAFADPTAPATPLPRESIELRTLAFY